MPQQNRITIQLTGALEDDGNITLSAFLGQLEAVKAALKQTERLLTGDEEPSVYYRIVDLSHNSPATVVLEAVSLANRPQPQLRKKRIVQKADYSSATVNQFFHSLKQIREKRRAPEGADLQTLEAFRTLAAPINKTVAGMKVIDTTESVDIDQSFQSAIDEIIGPDELVEGSISGTLEKLNLHNTTRFDIFPSIGPRQVACDFPLSLKADVIRAVDQYVRVSGKLRYKRLDKFPYAINADKIDPLPPDDGLPTLFDLKGIAPEITGGKSISEFLEEIRDG